MGLPAILGFAAGIGAAMLTSSPQQRLFSYWLNRSLPNQLPDPSILAIANVRGTLSDLDYAEQMTSLGFDFTTSGLYKVGLYQWLNGTQLVMLKWRNKLSDDEFYAEAKKIGFAIHEINSLETTLRGLPPAQQLIMVKWRTDMPDVEFYAEAERIGWGKKEIDDLAKTFEAIPSAQDVIAFAVREVYTPEIAEAFGQYEGGEAVYNQAESDIKAIGMSKPTFTKYWAAHWALPGIREGYEMLHRDVIKGDELDRLMVALDIMPFWRDKLKLISFNPYTRVDVRRMHKIGILTIEELKRAYMDLGYDDEHAQGMTDFTIKYNYEPPQNELTSAEVEVAKERDLTKADVLNGYKTALLEVNEVKEALATLGYSDDEIDYYLAKIDYAKEKDETDTYLKNYHDAYLKNVMSYNEMTDKLDELNLTGARKVFLLKMWDLEKLTKTNKPTKSELMTFFRKEIIDEPTLKTELAGLGYSERYVNWYIEAR